MIVELDINNRAWFRKNENLFFFELCMAYLEARLGKRRTFDEHRFEINAMQNLLYLKQSIWDRTYKPSRGTAHIIHNPVIREIFAAPFRDRVVHHFIYDNVYEWWDRHLIYDAYSCREGKGTLAGIQRLRHHIQSASDGYREEVWVFKFDISGYFMHLPRVELYKRAIWGLDRQFGDDKNWRYDILKFLWREIIFDDPCKDVVKKGRLADWDALPADKSMFIQPPGQGIVIGNLTSQLLSNIYLDVLDRYIMFDLGFKHYGRYVDDFYIVVTKDELVRAKKSVPAIETKVEAMGLKLHPTKRRLQKASKGVEFLGAVVYPGRLIVGKRLKANFRQALSEVVMGQRDLDTVVSYLGHVKYMDSDKLVTELFHEVGWSYKV